MRELDRHEAVRFLHERYRRMIRAPSPDGVDRPTAQDGLFTLQLHACDLMDRRSGRGIERCFAAVERLLAEGDAEVRVTVWEHFLEPHLPFQPNLDWARRLMPPLLADACARKLESIGIVVAPRPSTQDDS